MKDYLRQKSKYLPPITAWVASQVGLPRDIIPSSIEFEEKVYHSPMILRLWRRYVVRVRCAVNWRRSSPTVQWSPFNSYQTSKWPPNQNKTSLHKTRTAILLHHGREGNPVLDDPEWLLGTTSCRSNPHRFRTRLRQAEVVAYAYFMICARGRRVWLLSKRQGSIDWKEGNMLKDGDIIHFQFSKS